MLTFTEAERMEGLFNTLRACLGGSQEWREWCLAWRVVEAIHRDDKAAGMRAAREWGRLFAEWSMGQDGLIDLASR